MTNTEETFTVVWGDQAGCANSLPGNNEGYSAIRQRFLAEGVLWEDSQFPPLDAHCIAHPSNRVLPIQWMRTKDIDEHCAFIEEEWHKFDNQPNYINDSQFVGAVTQMTLLPGTLFQRVVPLDQLDGYIGAYHFRFWQFDHWEEVVVDDRLPVCQGRLVLSGSSHNGFWTPLLEKAYAKLYGSYKALEGTSVAEALVHLTGAVSHRLSLKDNIPDLFLYLRNSFDKSSTICCNRQFPPAQGPTCSVTGLESVLEPGSGNKLRLLRLHSPWPCPPELPARTQYYQEILNSLEKDSTTCKDMFWISFADFVNHFTDVVLCHLNPDGLDPKELQLIKKQSWSMKAEEGEFNSLVQGDGQSQYLVSLMDDAEGEEGESQLIIGLMQQLPNNTFALANTRPAIGFSVHRLNDDQSLDESTPIRMFSDNSLEVSARLRLSMGDYAITVKASTDCRFLLRVLWESNLDDSGFCDSGISVHLNPLTPPLQGLTQQILPSIEETPETTIKPIHLSEPPHRSPEDEEQPPNIAPSSPPGLSFCKLTAPTEAEQDSSSSKPEPASPTILESLKSDLILSLLRKFELELPTESPKDELPSSPLSLKSEPNSPSSSSKYKLPSPPMSPKLKSETSSTSLENTSSPPTSPVILKERSTHKFSLLRKQSIISLGSELFSFEKQGIHSITRRLPDGFKPSNKEMKSFYQSAVTLYSQSHSNILNNEEQNELIADIQLAEKVFNSLATQKSWYLNKDIIKEAFSSINIDVVIEEEDSVVGTLIRDHVDEDGFLSFLDFVVIIRFHKVFDQRPDEGFPVELLEVISNMIVSGEINRDNCREIMESLNRIKELYTCHEEGSTCDSRTCFEPVLEQLQECYAKDKDESLFFDFTNQAAQLIELMGELTDSFADEDNQKEDVTNCLINFLESNFKL